MDRKEWHPSQRGFFAGALYEAMISNKDIWLVCADLGWGIFDKHFKDFPDRCINTGAAEQAGMGLAVGLALENKQVFTYTITSFYLRAAETIGLYVAGEGVNVKMVGSGVNDSYKHDGPSHHGRNAQNFMKMLGIESIYPQNKEEAGKIVEYMLLSDKPSFVGLQR